MAGILTQPHFQRLEALRRVRHVLQGEEGSISFLKRDAATGALVELLSVDQGWTLSDRDASGDRLPAHVQFELQVAEELITAADVQQTMAIQHGTQRFQIVRFGAEPGLFEPRGLSRFWRFWVAEMEEV